MDFSVIPLSTTLSCFSRISFIIHSCLQASTKRTLTGAPVVKHGSQFASPEAVEGKVGVTGSGAKMTEFERRKRHNFSVLGPWPWPWPCGTHVLAARAAIVNYTERPVVLWACFVSRISIIFPSSQQLA